jgi:hypothetical protein
LIAPALAAMLGRPDLARSYLGVVDGQLSLEPAQVAAASAAGPLGGACVGDFSQPVDLLMADLSGMTQVAREPGGRVAMAPGAVVRNLGPGDVQWYRSIAPASPVGPHPYLALHFYRLSGGVLEQIGRGDLKHTFFSTNTGCDCLGGQVLYVGCEDFYGVSTNISRLNLAPRDEIDALTLAWSSLGSHFDGVPVDDFRHHQGDSAHDAYQHRLVVREPDLQTPGARYFYDGWYMAPNDTNLENSMGHREVDPTFAGSTWSFPTVDAGTANRSILDVFVDPLNLQPGQASELHDTGEGRVHLAVVSSALGAGVFHYEYALMNFDFERKIESFSIPIGAGHVVSNAGFGDANGNALDDWTVSIGGGRVTWTAPAGNALDWGTLYNFRLDVNAPPGDDGHGEPEDVREPMCARGGSSMVPRSHRAFPLRMLRPSQGNAAPDRHSTESDRSEPAERSEGCRGPVETGLCFIFSERRGEYKHSRGEPWRKRRARSAADPGCVTRGTRHPRPAGDPDSDRRRGDRRSGWIRCPVGGGGSGVTCVSMARGACRQCLRGKSQLCSHEGRVRGPLEMAALLGCSVVTGVGVAQQCERARSPAA